MKQLYSLNKYFWKYRWHFILGLVFVVLTNYFRILAPQLTGYVVNTVVHAISGQDADRANRAIQKDESNYDFMVQAVIQQ
ncbi:MAG: hypothetical protein NTX08_07375, partial [Sphingobacteriales bacterium]|nr:hypothetical protein [Sphingobacteriales bacterium]